MRKPIFTQADLDQIRTTAAQTSDIVHADNADWILRVTRDRTDIGIPAGTFIVARKATAVPDGEIAVIVENGEHVLRKAPVEGHVVGVVLGVLVREVGDER